MYAVFHAPTYRSRYAEFLKIDFPRLPLTRNPALFRALCTIGARLVSLHLLAEAAPSVASYPVPGDDTVEFVRFEMDANADTGRVHINRTQYFDGVPVAVWNFHVGGHQGRPQVAQRPQRAHAHLRRTAPLPQHPRRPRRHHPLDA